MSETAKTRHLTVPYCTGNGLDIGSGGKPVVPWALQIDLPDDKFAAYNSNHRPESSIQWRGDCRRLPFHPNVFDFVYSSHVLEDFADWKEVVNYWATFVKVGGHMIIQVPDRVRFAAYIAAGGPPNCAHQHEFLPGELTEHFQRGQPWKIIRDSHTDLPPGDHNILFIAQRLA